MESLHFLNIAFAQLSSEKSTGPSEFFFYISPLKSLQFLILIFLRKYSQHFLVVFKYPGADFTINLFKEGVSLYFSFSTHTYFKMVVSFAFFWLLNDVLCLLVLLYKFSLGAPGYTLPGLTVFEAMCLRITSLWQLPSSGQSFLFLQLHWSFGVIFSSVTFLIRVLIILDKSRFNSN